MRQINGNRIPAEEGRARLGSPRGFQRLDSRRFGLPSDFLEGIPSGQAAIENKNKAELERLSKPISSK